MSPLILIVIALIVVAGGVGFFLLSKQKGSGPSKQKPLPVIEDEEGTQVKIVGHRLVRLQGGVKVGNEFPVTSSVSIGSAGTSGFTVSDPGVSPVHATVRLEGGRAVVEDAGSGSGTTVNDERISAGTSKPLRDGDLIKIGSTTILYKSGS
jgi:pSer/pThr/pTyr-binding forkhead associated (FHA) protein